MYTRLIRVGTLSGGLDGRWIDISVLGGYPTMRKTKLDIVPTRKPRLPLSIQGISAVLRWGRGIPSKKTKPRAPFRGARQERRGGKKSGSALGCQRRRTRGDRRGEITAGIADAGKTARGNPLQESHHGEAGTGNPPRETAAQNPRQQPTEGTGPGKLAGEISPGKLLQASRCKGKAPGKHCGEQAGTSYCPLR